MYRFLLVLLLAACVTAAVLSDVNQSCINENSEAWSNDHLVGAWYKIRKYTLFGGLVPSISCSAMNFTKPTGARLQEYKDKYNDPNQPFNLDHNPILVLSDDDRIERKDDAMVMGNNIAKFYILAPDNPMSLGWDNYKVDAYRILTPKYIMYSECAMRGNTRWLLSTDRSPPVDEVTQLAKNTPELARLEELRFCA